MILPTRLIRHTPNGGYMLQILSDDAWTSNILKNVIVKVFMTILVSVLVSEIDVFWGACSKNHLQNNCTCLTKKLEVHALFRCLTDTWERFQENWVIFVDRIVFKVSQKSVVFLPPERTKNSLYLAHFENDAVHKYYSIFLKSFLDVY